MKCSIIIPFHERPNAKEHLFGKVFPALSNQGAYSFSNLSEDTPCISGGRLGPCMLYHSDKKDFAELIVVPDAAVRPDAKNCCLQINVGLKLATGDVFILLHQDVVPDYRAIVNLVNNVTVNPNYLYFATVYKQRFEGDKEPAYWVGPNRKNEAYFVVGFRRDKMIEVGGVEESFYQFWGCEDLEWLDRAKKHFNVEYVNWATATHLWHTGPRDQDVCGHNMSIYSEMIKDPKRIANAGRPWGELYKEPEINTDVLDDNPFVNILPKEDVELHTDEGFDDEDLLKM